MATQSTISNEGSDDSYVLVQASPSDNDVASDPYSIVEEAAAPSAGVHASSGTSANPNSSAKTTTTPAAPSLSYHALAKENDDLKVQVKWFWQELGRHNEYEEPDVVLKKQMKKLETTNKKLEVVIEGLEYENETLKDENWELQDKLQGLQNELQCLLDEKDELEEETTFLRKSRNEWKAKAEKLEREKLQVARGAQATFKEVVNGYQTIIYNIQTEYDSLQDENAKLNKQRNQDMRNHIADSDIARDNIAYTTKLEGACGKLGDEIKELKNDLMEEQIAHMETRKLSESRQKWLKEQRASHREDTAKLHEALDNYVDKTLDNNTELMEQDETIRTLKVEKRTLAKQLDDHRKETADKAKAFLTVFNDQKRDARKLKDENDELRRELEDARKAQGEKGELIRSFLEPFQSIQTPPSDLDVEYNADE